jgi:predicted metal-dependent phosphoesterase TrpH
VALTDHDNLDGIAEARRAASEHGIEVISGAELSVGWPRGAMHLLVYFLEPNAGPLQDRLRDLQDGRRKRNLLVVEKLNELGLHMTYEEVSTEAQGRGVGRPHIASVMVQKGYVSTMQQAFDDYLGAGRPAYRERFRLDYTDAIELARASKAVPVVAHPHTIGVSAEDFATAFRELADAGVMGIEAYYSEYEEPTRQHLASLAAALGLVATGGSDYHGRFRPDFAIGTGRGDLRVPETAAVELRAIQASL